MSPANNTSNGGQFREDPRRVFVASTSKVMDASWLKRAMSQAASSVREKYEGVELQPWRTAFEPGDITSSRLIELAAEVAGAVVILSRDDYVEREEEEPTFGPRDNLLLEAGLFLGRLGLANVLLLREENSKWPSDLEGVTVANFTQPDAHEKGNAEIVAQSVAMAIEEFLERLMSRNGSPAGRAVRLSSERLRRDAQRLDSALNGEEKEEPLVFPSPGLAYLDAVDEVNSEFITTTYLKSEFWTSGREMRTVAANEEMLQRITAAEGQARRLILLRKPLEEELEDQRQIRKSARSRESSKVEKLNQEFFRLEKANTELMDQGFEVKVVFDRDAVHEELPELIDFESGDTELALYDDRRVDVFTGFTSKKKSNVKAFVNGHFSQFRVLRQEVGRYFDQLWDSKDARDFTLFAAEMKTLIRDVDREIDYTSNWLGLYDTNGGPDGELKGSESTFVRDRLAEKYRGVEKPISGHLDLGTCTGRYMNELSELVADDGRIVGIDIDQDCVDYVKGKKQAEAVDPRTDVSRGDIRRRDQLPDGRFDVVTCMMGTLCHLERVPKAEGAYQDEWQTGLENIRDLLDDNGDAFIAVWDERACGRAGGDHELLAIYEEHARSVLSEQTPGIPELAERLEQAGLATIKADNLNGRLRVFQLRRAETRNGIGDGA